MNKIAPLIQKMIKYNHGNAKRISHALKVHNYAKTIAILEKVNEYDLFNLESAAILHDIGIRVSEEKYGFQNGKLQEQEGPTPAREICTSLGFKEDDIERICFLIAHHHTYTDVDGIDYRILLEADFLVNAFEGNASIESIQHAKESFFETETGKHILDTMFKS